MKVFATVVIVTAVWIVLARVLGGGLHGATGPQSSAALADAWMWEEHDGVVSLRQDAPIPAGHPLAKLGGGRLTPRA